LKKLAMLVRDARWCCKSLLNHLEQLLAIYSSDADERSRCVHQAPRQIAPPAAIAQQKELPVSEVSRDPREQILDRSSQ
jgi:hypothetical protein